jgi:hypothetical protein
VTRTDAETLVHRVFGARGQPNVNDNTKLAAIDYSPGINIDHLFGSISDVVKTMYGITMNSSVTTNWTTVGDVVTSVQNA